MERITITDPNYTDGHFCNSTYEDDFVIGKPNNRYTECQGCGKSISAKEFYCTDCSKPEGEGK